MEAAKLISAAWFTLLIAGAAGSTTTTARTAAIGPAAVTVRVYQTADLSAAIEQRALAEVDAALRPALVDVHWRTCSGARPCAACLTTLASSEFILRIERNPYSGTDRPSVMGEALVVRRQGGVLASVYVDRVAKLAADTKGDVAVLLGRVIAHELAHLLMHTVTHPRAGLMRANWTREEVRRNRAADWMFTPDDVAAMHRSRASTPRVSR